MDLIVANSRENEAAGASTTNLNFWGLLGLWGLLGIFIELKFWIIGVFFTVAAAFFVICPVNFEVAGLAKGFEVFFAVVCGVVVEVGNC